MINPHTILTQGSRRQHVVTLGKLRKNTGRGKCLCFILYGKGVFHCQTLHCSWWRMIGLLWRELCKIVRDWHVIIFSESYQTGTWILQFRQWVALKKPDERTRELQTPWSWWRRDMEALCALLAVCDRMIPLIKVQQYGALVFSLLLA